MRVPQGLTRWPAVSTLATRALMRRAVAGYKSCIKTWRAAGVLDLQQQQRGELQPPPLVRPDLAACFFPLRHYLIHDLIMQRVVWSVVDAGYFPSAASSSLSYYLEGCMEVCMRG